MGMPSSTAGLLAIGEFSRLSQFSVRMLRHYDGCDLLVPEFVDPVTGYRYYGGNQLTTAGQIRTLRDIGCPIAEIGRLLPLFAAPASLAEALATQRDRLKDEASRIDAQLREVDRLAAHLKEITMSIDVRQLDMPAMLVAAVRDRIPTYADEGELWQQIMPLLQQSGADVAADCLGGATFYDPEYRESDVDVEVWMQVTAEFTPIPPLVCRTEPARQVVCTTVLGDYAQMPSAIAAIGAYIAEHQLTTGPMFNIYRVSPAQNPDPASWVTDVCFPIVTE